MGWALLFAIVIGGTVGAGVGILLIYLASDEFRWAWFLECIGYVFDNPLTRPVMETSIGRWMNRKTVLGYIRAQKFEKAADLAVKEGLVDESIAMLETSGRIHEAARLAKRIGRDEQAERLYRTFIGLCLDKGRNVTAAETAEEAGFWEDAVNMYRGLEGKESRLKAAKLSAAHGLHGLALEIFLKEEALLDAMRVAEDNGKIDFLIDFCRNSENPVLHHFGADAARRAGKPEVAVDILLSHGHLHHAAQIAQQTGLKDKAAELIAEIRRKRAEARKEIPKSGGLFDFDFSDEP